MRIGQGRARAAEKDCQFVGLGQLRRGRRDDPGRHKAINPEIDGCETRGEPRAEQQHKHDATRDDCCALHC
jgi:hypothetical protein